MAIDLDALWDFGEPAFSEQRLRDALESAKGDDALVLQTQIARTYGLRRDFERARRLLDEIERQVKNASAEARVRHALEYGRTLASAAHSPESQTEETKEQARAAYMGAFSLAQAEHLDGLAIDALHMITFVDTEPAEQLKWGQEALAICEASSQQEAQKWEASLRNNSDYALHQLERYDEALEQFQLALALREQGDNAEAIRVAHWMIGWTLRTLGRHEEALEIQLRLEREYDEAGRPDTYVLEELEHLYREHGDIARADTYAQKQKDLAQ